MLRAAGADFGVCAEGSLYSTASPNNVKPRSLFASTAVLQNILCTETRRPTAVLGEGGHKRKLAGRQRRHEFLPCVCGVPDVRKHHQHLLLVFRMVSIIIVPMMSRVTTYRKGLRVTVTSWCIGSITPPSRRHGRERGWATGCGS